MFAGRYSKDFRMGLCHARSVVTKSDAFRFATASNFAPTPLTSHTLRAAWANLQAELPFQTTSKDNKHDRFCTQKAPVTWCFVHYSMQLFTCFIFVKFITNQMFNTFWNILMLIFYQHSIIFSLAGIFHENIINDFSIVTFFNRRIFHT